MHLFTFSSQGSSCPSPAYLLISISAFSAENFLSHVGARLIRKCWVPNFRHFVTTPAPLTLICHYLSLFATIRDYSYYSLFAIRDCSLFAIRDYSLFAIRVFQTPKIYINLREKVSFWSLSPSRTLEPMLIFSRFGRANANLIV